MIDPAHDDRTEDQPRAATQDRAEMTECPLCEFIIARVRIAEMHRSWTMASGMAVLLSSVALRAAEPSPDDDGSVSSLAAPFFQQHCLHCHGPDEAEGGLRLDQLDADLSS